MTLETSVLTRLDQVRAIEAEWAALHDDSGARLPFSAPEWGLTWLEHFAASGPDSPLVVEVREDGRLLGLAACYRHRMRGGLNRVQPVIQRQQEQHLVQKLLSRFSQDGPLG